MSDLILRAYRSFIFFLLSSFYTSLLYADDHGLTLRVGALELSGIDSVIRVDSSDGAIGVAVDFEDDLAIDKQFDAWMLEGEYGFSRRHYLAFRYYEYQRKGRVVIDKDITFADTTFDEDRLVTSQFNSKILELFYQRRFHTNSQVVFDLGAGLRFDHLNIHLMSVTTNLVVVEQDFESASGTLIMPMFVANSYIALNESIYIGSKMKQFFLESGNVKGAFSALEAFVQYDLSSSFALGLSVAKTSTDIETDSRDLQGEYNHVARTVFTYLSYKF